MLGQLCNLNGVSGNEDEVRKFILGYLSDRHVERYVDRMGNVHAMSGGGSTNRLMLTAHMDEIGLMIMTLETNGTLRFSPVGGIDQRLLPGTRVVIGRNRVPGIIGVKPIHLQVKEEREKAFPIDTLFIDCGFVNEKEAEKYVKPGEYAAFDVSSKKIGDDHVMGKAMDNRTGCAILLRLLAEYKNLNFTAVFTVQEEVGARGALTAANIIQPEAALVVETTAAAVDHETSTTGAVAGSGPAITIMDETIMVKSSMRKELADLAESNNIPYQYRRSTGAGTEGGAISLSGRGIDTAVISVPCRYIHSPFSLLKMSDFEALFSLTIAWLENRQ